jgi:hypothetical protein
MAKSKPDPTPEHDGLDETRRLMGALVRMPPKPHEDMKLGKARKQVSGSAGKARKAKAKK